MLKLFCPDLYLESIYKLDLDSIKEKNIKGILVDLLQKISISSYHIYLSHPLVLLFSQLFLERLGYTSIMGSFLINTSIIFFIVVPFSIYYSKNKLIARYKNWFANLVL